MRVIAGCGIVEQVRALARHIFLANDKTGLQAPQKGTGRAVSRVRTSKPDF